MAWYDSAVFYHIYPLGMTGAPKQNEYTEPVERLNDLLPWIGHIKEIGCNAIYIGPLFESVGHGYETTDYRKLDSRLGTNETLKHFVSSCHEAGIRVIFDGVFNHTGRDFFAFKDIQKNRENSAYKDWYCNVNFGGNTEYNDGFSYENWAGYNLLVKLNQKNPAVQEYICDVIRYWVEEFDVDGIRLDAADVLDFEFMKALRRTANTVKPEFWLMGEVIHGDYSRWANDDTLHSVTNYQLHKALYSGYNDHNFFEIAHTVKRLNDMRGGYGMHLYNFVDNHDVERIASKLKNPAGFAPVHILLYTLPGIPSLYYGSEYAVEGKKGKGLATDDAIRPMMEYEKWREKDATSSCVKLVSALGKLRQSSKALAYGDYKELLLTNRRYAYSRSCDGETLIIMANNDDHPATISVSACGSYVGILSGKKLVAEGTLSAEIRANYGEVWVPESVACFAGDGCEGNCGYEESYGCEGNCGCEESRDCETLDVPCKSDEESNVCEVQAVLEAKAEEFPDLNKPLEEMSVPELQAMVLYKLGLNGTITDRMRQDVEENVYRDSLLNWVRSFR